MQHCYSVIPTPVLPYLLCDFEDMTLNAEQKMLVAGCVEDYHRICRDINALNTKMHDLQRLIIKLPKTPVAKMKSKEFPREQVDNEGPESSDEYPEPPKKLKKRCVPYSVIKRQEKLKRDLLKASAEHIADDIESSESN